MIGGGNPPGLVGDGEPYYKVPALLRNRNPMLMLLPCLRPFRVCPPCLFRPFVSFWFFSHFSFPSFPSGFNVFAYRLPVVDDCPSGSRSLFTSFSCALCVEHTTVGTHQIASIFRSNSVLFYSFLLAPERGAASPTTVCYSVAAALGKRTAVTNLVTSFHASVHSKTSMLILLS